MDKEEIKKLIRECIKEVQEADFDSQYEEAYEEGVNSALEGILRDKNPYIHSNYEPRLKIKLSTAWFDGWDLGNQYD